MRAKILIFWMIALCLPSAASGQSPGRPLRAELITDLQFPRIALLSTGIGQVTVDPATGTTSATGNIRIFSGTSLPATLSITGQPNSLVSIRVAPTADLVAASGQKIRLQNITSTGKGGIRLSRNGRADVNIGATLPVSSATQAGAYRGRITVAIDYMFE